MPQPPGVAVPSKARDGASPHTFQELIERRGRFAWTLAAIVLVLFYGFVMVVAFSPSVLGAPLMEGSRITVGQAPDFFEGGVLGAKVVGGGNMIAMHLAKAVGGNLLLGFLTTVAFATILAVVSGLALAGASAISHDLYARVILKGLASEANEMRVSKIATICLGIVAIGLGILFEKMNIAFLSAYVFSKLDASKRAADEMEVFEAQYVRAQTGYGAAKAAAH